MNICVDSSILQRKDEIGGIGRSIDNLKDKLGSIVEGIKAESDRFHEESEKRTDTIAIVQNEAAVSEENSASVEDIMASIGTVYQNIEKVSKDAKVLNELSQEMRAKVNVFVL